MAVGDFVHVLQAAHPRPQMTSSRQKSMNRELQAPTHMYTNAVIKLTEDWKLSRGSAMKFVASKIIFLDSSDGAGILSGLIGLAY